jgi:hypothetical protein
MASQRESCCRVCGTDAGLVVEDVPPKSAYNTNPAKVFGLEEWLRPGGKKPLPGPYTLCPDCIAHVGSWYLPEYQRWAGTAADAIARGPADSDLNATPRPSWTSLELIEVRPARFLKQVVTMLLAIAPADFVAHDNAELADYVLKPERTGLSDWYRFYLTLYRGPFARFVGYSARHDVETGRSEQLIELAYPPFSCVLSLDGDADIEGNDISGFADLGIDELCIVDLDLLNGFGHTPFPGDFRTLAAVERDREAGSQAAGRRAA